MKGRDFSAFHIRCHVELAVLVNLMASVTFVFNELRGVVMLMDRCKCGTVEKDK
jgi:hypothetical protein